MFNELLSKRRSIRKYIDKEIEQEKIDMLIEAALRSPSSRGLNPWSFVFITNKQTLEQLSLAKQHGSSLIKAAPLAIAVLADKNITDVWVEDTSIASIIIQLQAEDLGLGSCWVQIRNRNHNETIGSEKYVKNILQLEDNIQVESIIAIGYPAEEKEPHPKDSLQYEKVKFNS